MVERPGVYLIDMRDGRTEVTVMRKAGLYRHGQVAGLALVGALNSPTISDALELGLRLVFAGFPITRRNPDGGAKPSRFTVAQLQGARQALGLED